MNRDGRLVKYVFDRERDQESVYNLNADLLETMDLFERTSVQELVHFRQKLRLTFGTLLSN